MVTLLLAIIYLAFISLGLPDGLLGAAWPVVHTEMAVPEAYMGIISMIISAGTILSSLFSDKLTRRLGAGLVTAISVMTTAVALFGFSQAQAFWQLVNKAENAFVFAGMLFVNEICLEFKTKRSVVVLFSNMHTDFFTIAGNNNVQLGVSRIELQVHHIKYFFTVDGHKVITR